MKKYFLLFCGTVALLTGAGFLLWGATTWLALQLGALVAGVLVGVFLLIVGGLLFALASARAHARAAQPPPRSLGFGFLGEASPFAEIEGLAALCERHPLLASAVAVALGLATGFGKHRR